MPAPQAIGMDAPSGIGIYYVPPPNQPVNVFSAYWSSFQRARAPYASMVIAERLQQMRPYDATEAIAKLLEMEKDYRAKVIASGEKMKTGDSSVVVAAIGALSREGVAKTAAQAKLDATKMAVDEKAAARGELKPKDVKVVEDMVAGIATQMATGTAAGIAGASQQMSTLLDETMKLTPQQRTSVVGKLAEAGIGLTPEQQAELDAAPAPTPSQRVWATGSKSLDSMLTGIVSDYIQGPTYETSTYSSQMRDIDEDNDPFLSSLAAERARLMARHGSSPYIDLFAPVPRGFQHQEGPPDLAGLYRAASRPKGDQAALSAGLGAEAPPSVALTRPSGAATAPPAAPSGAATLTAPVTSTPAAPASAPVEALRSKLETLMPKAGSFYETPAVYTTPFPPPPPGLSDLATWSPGAPPSPPPVVMPAPAPAPAPSLWDTMKAKKAAYDQMVLEERAALARAGRTSVETPAPTLDFGEEVYQPDPDLDTTLDALHGPR